MEIITTFKGGFDDLENYQSIVIASEKFSIANDYTFSNTQIIGLLRHAKLLNVKVYILCNKMIFEEDLEELKSHLMWLKDLGISGIYFSDMAVYMLAKELEIEHLLIYAPGMTVVNSEDTKAYLDLDILGVELANELTLEEKIEIAKNNPNKVGIVIGGYLLMSFSKRKVLSNYFKAINKEVDIKDNYNLKLSEKTRENLMPIYEDDNGSYIYSEYIFHSFNVIRELLEAPFKYFRIDGIFLEQTLILEMLNSYLAALSGREDNFLNNLNNKYPKLKFDDVFYFNKTSEDKI